MLYTNNVFIAKTSIFVFIYFMKLGLPTHGLKTNKMRSLKSVMALIFLAGIKKFDEKNNYLDELVVIK